MRYATVVLSWQRGVLHPIDDVFARSEDVSLEAIRYVGPVYQGRYVELLELSGDLGTARRVLDATPAVIGFDVAGDGESGVAYVRCHTAGLVGDLLAILEERGIALRWPMRYVDGRRDRALELTVFGTNRAVQRAVADLPPEIDIALERTGQYDPDVFRLGSVLTDRQCAVLELAVSEGYYEVPRETTHRELATNLGVSPATVSEHLQRIEAKILGDRLEYWRELPSGRGPV